MAAIYEMERQACATADEAIARRRATRRNEIDAEDERVQRIRVEHRSVLQMRTGRCGAIDDGYTRKMPDHGEGLPVAEPWVDSLGEQHGVEELDFG